MKTKNRKKITTSKKISVNGCIFTLIRSDRKTVSVEINPNLGVVLRAPSVISDSEAIEVIRKNSSWIASATERQQKKKPRKEPTPDEVLDLKAKAKAIIPERVKVFAALMKVDPTAITITSAKTRFGSCSGKNGLSFSYLLMQYPEPAIDYVVVHELAHIKHKNHGKGFYAEIEKYMPDYKDRRKLLK
ncbi:MAG: M48 family metallopeptidase [Eubacteriales bacterium]|nr:M48 family metallopeptidase [Eubacteriales bacterium]MDD4474543.1 M48 family metallopeptidase [Eubacteriales bacterium]